MMKIFKYKKSGFSLTEIALALLIVAVLAAVTIPIIGNQIAKTDEYAYYMAYRTVEKMAGQIVAHGDPLEDANFETSYLPESTKIAKVNNNRNGFLYYLKHKSHLANTFNKAITKMAYAEKYIFSKLFPNTIAVTENGLVVTTDTHNWTSADFDSAWLRVGVCYDFNSSNATTPRKDIPCKKGTERAVVTLFTQFEKDPGAFFGRGIGGEGDGDKIEKFAIKDLDWNKVVIYSQDDVDWINSYISDTTDSDGKYTVYYRPATGNNAKDNLYPECLVDCSEYNSSTNFQYLPAINKFDDDGKITIDAANIGDLGRPNIFQLISASAKIYDNDDFRTIYNENTCHTNPYSTNVYNSLNAWSSSESIIRPNAQSYCNGYFSTNCTGESGSLATGELREYSVQWIAGATANDDDDDETDPTPLTPTSSNPGTCKITTTITRTIGDDGGAWLITRNTAESFDASWCTDHGYINMINKGAPNYVDCQCKNNYVPTENNDRACGPKSLVTGANRGRKLYHDPVLTYEGQHASYITNPTEFANDVMALDSDGNAFKSCKYGFAEPFSPLFVDAMSPNMRDGYCCPQNGHATSNGCVCNPRYIETYTNGHLTACTLNSCPEGYHKVTFHSEAAREDIAKCLKNPAIVKGNRFCELITEHWNVKNSTCDNFTNTGANNVTYYAAAQTAARGTDSVLMSAAAKEGAFQNLTPNLVLSNGLKMWISGDKAASIPMLSYYTSSMSDTQNACVHILKNKNDDHSQAACTAAGGYYCGGDELSCMKIDSSTNLADARNCCASPKFDGLEQTNPMRYAISGYTVYVDINGNKGDGTLWKDVYPFFISTNGTVYPAYPLNANEESGLKYVGGNNQKQLSVDVYYFDKDETKGKQKRIVFSDVPYARGMCLSGQISANTPYCQNLGNKFHAPAENACDTHDCTVVVRKRLRFL